MPSHIHEEHDLHDFDGIGAPASDGTYLLKMTKTGENYTYEYVNETSVGGPTVVIQTVSPQNAPGAIGDIYVDTISKDVYIATGTSGYGDWILVSGA